MINADTIKRLSKASNGSKVLMVILSQKGRSAAPLCSSAFALVISRALAGREVRFKVSGKKFSRAFNGWTGHGNEIAKALPFVESEDFAELLEDRLAALSLLHFLQQ